MCVRWSHTFFSMFFEISVSVCSWLEVQHVVQQQGQTKARPARDDPECVQVFLPFLEWSQIPAPERSLRGEGATLWNIFRVSTKLRTLEEHLKCCSKVSVAGYTSNMRFGMNFQIRKQTTAIEPSDYSLPSIGITRNDNNSLCYRSVTSLWNCTTALNIREGDYMNVVKRFIICTR